jgi:hypothetical protein
MSNNIFISIQCTNRNKNANIVNLIQKSYYKETGKNDFDLVYFDIFLEDIDITLFINNETTLNDFLMEIQSRFKKMRQASNSTIYNIITEIIKKKYNFTIIVILKQKTYSTSKKRRIDYSDISITEYNIDELYVNEQKVLPFVFNDCVEFIKYIMKQHVFDKLHDTVYTRCVKGNSINPQYKSLESMTTNKLKTYLCEIRKVLRSPLISIFTNFIESDEITVEMGKEIILWLSNIFPAEYNFSIGNTKEELIQNIKNICELLDRDNTATCGNMEEYILADDMKKIEKQENIQTIKGNLRTRLTPPDSESATLVSDNAMSVKGQYIENTTSIHSLPGLIDGASNDISAKFLNGAKQNDGTQLYTKCTPIKFHMFWEEDPNNFYQIIEIKLGTTYGKANGKIDIIITLCIGGISNSTVIENYDLFSEATTNATYFNSDSIIEMITNYKNGGFNKNTYNSTQYFGKALGDFLKNMEWFTIIGGEYIPYNEKSVHNTNVVAIGATDRLSSALALELGTESTYKVDKTNVGKVIITAKGHISTIVTLFLDKFKKITDYDENTSKLTKSNIEQSKSTFSIQGLSTISQILPSGFKIDESTNINDDYSLFRCLLYSLPDITDYNIDKFKKELGIEITYQMNHKELKSRFENENFEENRRKYMEQIMQQSYLGGFLEIQVFSTLYNTSVIVHDYSEGSELIHEFYPIPQLFKPNQKLPEKNTIHLYYDGTRYIRILENIQRGGSHIKKYNAIQTNIDLSTITDIDFVLSFQPLNPEHLKRFENHKKAFDDFLLFLNNYNIQNQIFIIFIFNGKEYSFFTSTLNEALLINKTRIQDIQQNTIKHVESQFLFTPLKISIRSADESSTKLPVTELNRAPQRGTDSNLRWYKPHNTPKTNKKLNNKSSKKRSNSFIINNKSSKKRSRLHYISPHKYTRKNSAKYYNI